MATHKLLIRKDSCKTDPIAFHPTSKLNIPGFNSSLGSISIVTEDLGSKAIYGTSSSSLGFMKKDNIEFRKVWLEYNASDEDYEVELSVN